MNELIFGAPFGFETPLPVTVLGAISGLSYGLLGVGLVLIYRTNRVINFAHGQIGVVGAAVFGLAVVKWHIPYYVGFPLALAVGAAVAMGAEVAVVRRLAAAPKVMGIVATLGVGQFLLFLTAVVNAELTADFPSPPFLPEFTLGALKITRPYVAISIFGPLVTVALAIFLKRSRFGIGIRSAAANPEAARMAGIRATRMSSLAWGLGGALSTFTALLVLPTIGSVNMSSFGPSLLLRALAVGVVARMNNLVVALAAGVGLGVIEQLLFWNYPTGGLVEVVIFLVILSTMFFLPSQQGREQDRGSWAAVEAWRPIPDAFRQVWTVRNVGKLVGALGLALAIIVPLVTSNSAAVSYVTMIAFALVGLSVGIITGLGGELSLGQFALGGIGAWVSYEVSTRTGNFFLSFIYAGIIGGIVLVLIALPSLRARGLMLTVTTLSFALVVPSWLLAQPWALESGVGMGRPIVAGNPIDTGRSYYFFCLFVFVVMFLLARNLWKGGFGRLLRAVRDNEDNARAFTVPASRVKVQSFFAAGFMAAIAGALYGHLLSLTAPDAFPIDASINSVIIAVLGGISILIGPLLGVFYIIGLPTFVQVDAAVLAASSFGWLLLILYVPSGLAGAVRPLRDRAVAALARLGGITIEGDEVASETTDAPDQSLVTARPTLLTARVSSNGLPPVGGATLLQGANLVKHFGGLTAVDGVSIEVTAGKTLGLIGPNGAGKTTLFELLSGFVTPDGGTVAFLGDDITSLSPEERGRQGLIRSFQDAYLFPTMTVTETIKLSLERLSPSGFLSSLIGLRGGERAKDRRAREIISAMGLESYKDKQVRELSTGTRRITELACLVALEPTLLLLDEPSSGIAQRETEALGEMLTRLKAELDVTLLVIEHDIPLIMGISDRIVAMDAGRVIAQGPPSIVRHDASVIEAYLGGSLAAIERSGTAGGDRGGRDVATSEVPAAHVLGGGVE